MSYHYSATGGIIRDADGVEILPTPDYYNDDHQAFLAWLAEGNTPAPYDGTPNVPREVPMWAARRVLIAAGLMQPILSALAAMPGIEGEIARSDFEFAPNIVRSSPFIAHAKDMLGLTDAQIDDLFVQSQGVVNGS